MAKIRTLPKAAAELKERDPNTSMTITRLRRLVKEGKIRSFDGGKSPSSTWTNWSGWCRVADSFAYLVNAGWPLERLRWYMANNINMDEMAEGVKDMVARGMAMDEIIEADSRGREEEPPPSTEDKSPPTLDTITAADLQKKEIPPIRFIVNKLLTVGLNILASPPKYGKSWMVLALCLAVSMGGGFWDMTLPSANVYIWLWRTASAV